MQERGDGFNDGEVKPRAHRGNRRSVERSYRYSSRLPGRGSMQRAAVESVRRPDIAMSAPSDSLVRFGTFQLDLRTGELRKAGVRINLPEQPFQVLKTLLDHPGD